MTVDFDAMVCAVEDCGVECVVRDCTSRDAQPKFKLSLHPSTTVIDIFNYVAQHYSYDVDSFELVLQSARGEVVELNEVKEKNLMEIGLNFSNETKYTLVVSDVSRHASKDAAANRTISSIKTPLFSPSSGDYNRPAPAFQSQIQEFTFNHKSVIKPETSYVGLVNQAMTCYLNSLLQALYMTPEFRNALYNWEYVDGSEKDEAKSIPYQLQKLFLNLQTSTKPAVETTSLTKSFGWDSTEAWQQHDIQELCRVMFDALEQKFKNTQQADLINRLYEGKMIDYVKCLECSTEKSREDTFLDIPLPVRPFGSNVAYNSVEEALRAFVQPETLDGTNQYHCEKCNKKCNAHKGLKFSKFPYLLTLHLKRFDFDYNTLHRIKLNDKVTFPDVLNLNSFVASTSAHESPGREEDTGVGVKCDDSSTTDSGTLDDECPPCDNSSASTNQSTNHDQDDDEGIDVSNGPSTSSCSNHNHENEKNSGNRAIDKGPYQYELFSIMIHSGSASGGHYYAYIKDLMTQEWFCFNDQSVTRITYDDIQKTYGGGPTRAYYSGAYSSSTNAYMLMYRQIDPHRNKLPMQAVNFPKHIQDLLKKMKESEENDRKNREKQMSMCKLKVYCHHPEEGRLTDAKLYVLQDETLQETTEVAHRRLGLEGIVKLDQCRLVSYDHNEDLIERSWEGSELMEPIGDIWRNNSRFDLLLQIRRKDEQFETYLPGGVATKVFVVDIDKEEVVDGPISVRGLLTQTIREYKLELSKLLKLDAKQIKLVLQKYPSDSRLLDKDDNMLQSEGFYGPNKIFVATALDTDETKPFHESKLQKIIENFEYIISLRVLLPDTSKETLDDLNIPSLEETRKGQEKSIANGPIKSSLGDMMKTMMTKNSEQTKPSCGIEETPPKTNTSAQLGEGEDWNTPEQSNSEDSSLSDSERTLMGDVPDYTNCVEPQFPNSGIVFDYAPPKLTRMENWDIDDESDYYFKAIPHSEDSQKLLKVLVDKRMQLSTLKKDLEPLVGVPVEYFKVFRHSSDSGETECSRLTEQLSCYQDGERLSVKLGRALRSGEFKVKLFQLLIHSTEPFKFLCDWIVSNEMTVGQAKKEILAEIKRKYNIDIPYEKCRLRRKNYKTASKVCLDEEKFEVLRLYTQCELFVQELPDKETVKDYNQVVLFVRKWSPSQMQLTPFEEITMNGKSIEELKEKLSSISDIPAQYIEVAKGRNAFPCDISVLQVQSELNWNHQATTIDTLPLNLEDGSVVYFRDSREEPKQLSSEELKEIASKESSRLTSLSSTSSYSPRRERALKIYLDTK
ncbi:ubiquitin carboxyl-terminal hydrolase 47 isoform X1 [Neodiprion fabricii]|uniref:ubiquitin carboxyl-terminal hydrolase 47 isoform X1 n=2 Tax=Neodiprion fabricii TaxID=2872261 RepID=UPI001ED92B4E|nr:ubiquitin carboxyl-terminal hydrolase 47 isoform X1 [Neodiprion fabricii]XP_046413366.1 ubiquitin carboxyl-terminal hydrolase 47 isoform X1 [Neodiprion fabricii]